MKIAGGIGNGARHWPKSPSKIPQPIAKLSRRGSTNGARARSEQLKFFPQFLKEIPGARVWPPFHDLTSQIDGFCAEYLRALDLERG
jgi:hypothetical protein